MLGQESPRLPVAACGRCLVRHDLVWLNEELREIVNRPPDQLRDLTGVWQGAWHVGGAAAPIAIVAPNPPDDRWAGLLQYDLGHATMLMMLRSGRPRDRHVPLFWPMAASWHVLQKVSAPGHVVTAVVSDVGAERTYRGF